ncbi:MAG TPA: glutathione S-transferase family protein [Alphaproteobacteria bacterium]|nr:glutathione S-transferase family protein [Alphaproteobacteria bacterium]
MYTLFWSPGSASMAPHAMLEELSVPYELTRVNLDEPRDSRYLQLNPWNRVPTLLVDGKPIYEAAAICMHLCDRHPEKGLAPLPGSAERALYYQWLLFLADTLQPAFMRVYRPSHCSSDPADEVAIKEKGLKDVAQVWATLDRLLEGRSWLVGERFSAADIYLHMLYTWDFDMSGLARRHANLAALFRRIHERPAVARVAELNM